MKQLQNFIRSIATQYPEVKNIADAIHAHGGTVLCVGGAVRDTLLGLPTKDIDCEVYGLMLHELEDVLKKFGPVSLVGKSFGVLRVHGLDVDWSLPRADKAGRKPDVHINPYMAYADAFRRRDLTINAMGVNIQTGEFVDPYNGYQDLESKVLRAPDVQTFVEDPLRFFRVMQFVGRFEMYVDPQLQELCKAMDISAVSCERIEAEFEKLLLRSRRPSLGIRWLYDVGRLQDVLPELYINVGVPQRPDYHPEGDVFEHSMQTLDAAANRVQIYDADDTEKKLILLYAAMAHDVGKKDTTEWVDNRWRSLGHAEVGAPLARTMLARITGKKKIIQSVKVLVYHHMDPGSYVDSGAKEGTYKLLAYKLTPYANIQLLGDLFLCDRQGRNGNGPEPLTTVDDAVHTFITNAHNAGVLYAPEEPVLLGKDLLDVLPPGKELGDCVAHAYLLQLRKGLKDKEKLKELVLQHAKKDV